MLSNVDGKNAWKIRKKFNRIGSETSMGCANSKGGQGQRKGQKQVRGLDGEGKSGSYASAGGMPRIKMVLLGDSGVGKSCLVLRFVRGQFDPSSKVTVGAAFMSHPVALPDSSTVKFEIWVMKLA